MGLPATNEERREFLVKKTADIQKQQQEELVSDYDQALAEQRKKQKTQVIKLMGKKYEVAPYAPFGFVMYYLRHCLTKRDGKTLFEVPDEKLEMFLKKMFGEQFMQDVEESEDVTFAFLWNNVVPDILSKWGMGPGKSKKK